MHVAYVPETPDFWISVYKASISSNAQYQLGGIYPGQWGKGLGSFFKSLFRWSIPLLKLAGKEALLTGAKIATDLAAGRKASESVKEHGKAAAGSLLKQAAEHVEGKVGGGKKRHKRYRRKAKSSVSKSKRRKIVGSTDIFDW
jgi:hypothetical protein